MDDQRGWFASNGLAIGLLLLLFLVAIETGNTVLNEYTLQFSVDQTSKVTDRLNRDVARIQNLGEQFSVVSSFLRLKFETPIKFQQGLETSVSPRELAAGAALAVEASPDSNPDERIYGTSTVTFTSDDATLCDTTVLNETFEVKDLQNRVDQLTGSWIPQCVDAYLKAENIDWTQASGRGKIYSLIKVSPDGLSRTAIYILSIVLWSSLTLLILKVYKMIQETIYFRRKK